jgi:hypothetical protein
MVRDITWEEIDKSHELAKEATKISWKITTKTTNKPKENLDFLFSTP